MGELQYLLYALLALAVVTAVIYFLYRRRNPEKYLKGAAGRQTDDNKAVAAMRGFARSNSFKFIAPLQLQRGDEHAGLNAVVVGYFGVLGIIALGYNGEVYGSADDDTWLQVAPDGERRHFPNPGNEASSAVRAIRSVLFENKLKKVPVEVVYVFTNSKVQLGLPRSTGHLRMKEFKALLKKDKYMEDAGFELEAVEKALSAANDAK